MNFGLKLSDGIVPRRDHRPVFFMKQIQSVLEVKKKNEKCKSQVKEEVDEARIEREKMQRESSHPEAKRTDTGLKWP